jgi:hypothetical protein
MWKLVDNATHSGMQNALEKHVRNELQSRSSLIYQLPA